MFCVAVVSVERKWADFELDDDYELGDLVNTASGFETKPDEEGIKTVTNYTQTLRGETLKVFQSTTHREKERERDSRDGTTKRRGETERGRKGRSLSCV